MKKSEIRRWKLKLLFGLDVTIGEGRMKFKMHLNLLVLRSLNPERLVQFYEVLGLHFQNEQHGSGPLHWAATVGDLVFEIYPARSAEEVNESTRIGFNLTELESILQVIRTEQHEIVRELTLSKWGERAVVKDPDGRTVELVQPS